jgi:beta-lactamase class A
MRSLFLVAISALLQSASTLSSQFAQIAATSGGRVQLIESGERDGLNRTERFPMQSVYKLPISMAILDQVERKALTLGQKVSLTEKDMAPAAFHSPMRDAHPHGGIDVSVQDLVRAAIVESDGVASDVLLRLAGGAPRVTAYLRGLGIRDMTVATSELAMSRDPKAQYRNDATPDAGVADEATREATIARIARAAFDRWSAR